MSSLTPEQLSRLKELIQQHLQRNQVFDTVKEMLEHQNLADEEAQEKILASLSQKGVLGDVLAEVQQTPQLPELSVQPNNRYILMKLQYGKAFVDFVGREVAGATFQLHIQFLQQRFASKKVPCSAEPVFDDSFLLNLSTPESGSVDFSSLVKLSSPIHVVLVKEINGKREVIATKNIEWRLMLCTSTLSFPVELTGLGTQAKISIGVLYFSLDLLPKAARGQMLTDRLVNEQLNLEKKYERDIAHGFFEYSNEWWRDFKQIRPGHEKRLVKIYAETEDGSYKPVCSLVQPLRANRLVDSPLQAARFVSLLPFVRDEAPGGMRTEVWHNMHTLLVRGAGDSEDHAVLLCGLLLGFCLDAYVCVGSSGEGPHTWVMTRGEKVTFWEALTGQRLESTDPRVHRYYRKVGCVFNHKSFYANIQVDDIVANTNWDLDDESLWKGMAPEMLEALVGVPKYLPLLGPVSNPQEQEVTIENDLKKRIEDYRKNTDLMTNWDSELSYLLSPALINYELDRVGNVTYGNEEFQESIQRYVPEGHTFKAYPVYFPHTRSAEMFSNILNASISQEIINTRGDTVRFALRVKLMAYPEEKAAVWVMLAVRFRSII